MAVDTCWCIIGPEREKPGLGSGQKSLVSTNPSLSPCPSMECQADVGYVADRKSSVLLSIWCNAMLDTGQRHNSCCSRVCAISFIGNLVAHDAARSTILQSLRYAITDTTWKSVYIQALCIVIFKVNI